MSEANSRSSPTPRSTTRRAPAADAKATRARRRRHRLDRTACGICHSYTPDGRCVSLLKILLTNYCIYDCAYCVNRGSSGVRRARFTPDEVVRLTLEFYRRNYIEGLVPQLRNHPRSRLHDGAAHRGRAHAARDARVRRLHPSQDDPERVAGADRRGRALGRSTQHQHRAAAPAATSKRSRRRKSS